jgi:opacity protein-like surface antigen
MFRSLLPLVTLLCVTATPALAETLDAEGSSATAELTADATATEEAAEKRRKGKKARNGADARPADGEGQRTAPPEGARARHAQRPAQQRTGGATAPGVRTGGATAPGVRARQAQPGAQRPAQRPAQRQEAKGGRANQERHSKAAKRQAKRQSQEVRVHRAKGLPPRWAPAYHRYHLAKTYPKHHPRYWGAGIFFYSPPPKGHKVRVVRGSGPGARSVQGAPTPSRAIDRNGDFSLGLQAGSYISGYRDGGDYSDLGFGLSVGYRPVETLGLQLDHNIHDNTFDEQSERSQATTSASMNIYAFPWTRVSPYATLGATWTERDIADTYSDGLVNQVVVAQDTLFGPHAGLGMEFAFGQNAGLNVEAKYVSYLDVGGEDKSLENAIQTNVGLKMYF